MGLIWDGKDKGVRDLKQKKVWVFPQTVEATQETDFDINMHEDDYRQNEFLNVTSLPLVEQEFAGIKEILQYHSEKSGDYTLFKHCHVRKLIGSPGLMIPFQKLQVLLNSKSIGQVMINNNVLKNGFAIKTENTTYFGALNAGMVTELCISQWNEDTITEIIAINNAFNLLFVNWCNCEIIKND